MSTGKDEFIFPLPMAEIGAHGPVEFNKRKESYFSKYLSPTA